MTVKEICALFNVGGKYLRCKDIPTGNINSSYKVTFSEDGEIKEYVIQKINKNVFKRPDKVMDNIIRVTHHVRMNVMENGLSTKTNVLRAFLARNDGKPFVIDDKGEYWRCYRFIKNSETYDTPESLDIVERVGSAFGKFQSFLDGFDAQSLYTTIPDFHNTKKRYEALKVAEKEDPFDRVKYVTKELEEIYALEKEATKLQKMLDNGEIPYRVTHNDTKCNNVSFDKDTGEALAVLDLDTVMPGAVAHDFGDAIRFIANTVIEDDPNVEDVALDMDKYRAFTKGFVLEVKENLTENEKKTLNLGALAMTSELAVRFLTDYILGDTYFKTKYPGHNLDRTHNQTALAKDILNKMDQMQNILNEYL